MSEQGRTCTANANVKNEQQLDIRPTYSGDVLIRAGARDVSNHTTMVCSCVPELQPNYSGEVIQRRVSSAQAAGPDTRNRNVNLAQRSLNFDRSQDCERRKVAMSVTSCADDPAVSTPALTNMEVLQSSR